MAAVHTAQSPRGPITSIRARPSSPRLRPRMLRPLQHCQPELKSLKMFARASSRKGRRLARAVRRQTCRRLLLRACIMTRLVLCLVWQPSHRSRIIRQHVTLGQPSATRPRPSASAVRPLARPRRRCLQLQQYLPHTANPAPSTRRALDLPCNSRPTRLMHTIGW